MKKLSCNYCEPRHAKTGLKIFVAAIPTEGLAGSSQVKVSFDRTRTIKLYCFLHISDILHFIFSVIQKEGLADAIGMTMTQILKPVSA